MEETTPNAEHLIKIVLEYTGKIQKISSLIQNQQKWQDVLGQSWNPFQEIFTLVNKNIEAHPKKMIDMQLSYWSDYFSMLQSTTAQWFNPEPQKTTLKVNDKRFSQELWEQHPLFNFFRDFYLLSTKYIESFTSNLEGLDEKTRNKVNFYTRQLLNALAPSNFIMTNPQLLHTTLQTNGSNVLQGLDTIIADLERNNGTWQVKMTDLDAFKLGENLAVTPGKIIYQNDLMQLIQYEPQTPAVHQRPLLIIPPWINKYYILDLKPDNSFIEWVVKQGYTVFLISWVNPDKTHADKDFEDYLLEGPLTALDVIEKNIGVSQINLVGYCIGGTLLACTLAYLAAKNDQRVVCATYLATMLDFSEPGELGVFINENQIQMIEKYMAQQGYLDGATLSLTFNSLRDNDLIWANYVNHYLAGKNPVPLDFLYWNSDSTNLPAKMQSFYLRNMYLNNLLVKPDGIELAGVPIDLRKIQVPVYFLSGERDHIAPWESTYMGTQLHSGPATFVLGGSGHIAGIVNPPLKNKYYYHTNQGADKNPSSFLNSSQQHPGSWWLHWEEWLRQHAGEKIDASNLIIRAENIIEDAPGSYVKMKS